MNSRSSRAVRWATRSALFVVSIALASTSIGCSGQQEDEPTGAENEDLTTGTLVERLAGRKQEFQRVYQLISDPTLGIRLRRIKSGPWIVIDTANQAGVHESLGTESILDGLESDEIQVSTIDRFGEIWLNSRAKVSVGGVPEGALGRIRLGAPSVRPPSREFLGKGDLIVLAVDDSRLTLRTSVGRVLFFKRRPSN